jgi:hypothetical protein
MVRENLKITQSRQKSYTYHKRQDLSFEVGDFMYHKVSHIRGLYRFKVRGKLAPRFIGPLKIIEKRGLAYQLEMPLEDMNASEDLTYQYPINILETSKRATWEKRIRMCNIQWSHHTKAESTWENEEELKLEFPAFFSHLPKSQDKIPWGAAEVDL